MNQASAPLVSIVIPCFLSSPEHADLLDQTLRTVEEQTYPHYEVTVVDDGSLVDVAAVTSGRRVTHTIREPNAGCAVARNTGIAASRGAFFVFLDNDDYLLPQALEAGVRALTEHPEAGFCIGPREEMTYEGRPVSAGTPPMPKESRLYAILLACDWFIIPPSVAMFRRHVVEELGGFHDPWGADDFDFYLRAAWRYPAVCYDAPPVTRYRRYSTSSSRDGERMLRSTRAVYERHRPLVAGNPALEAAFARGLSQLTDIFVGCLVENVRERVRSRQWRRAARSALVLARENPADLVQVISGAQARASRLGQRPDRPK